MAKLLILLAPIVAVALTVAVTYDDTRFQVAAEPSIAVLAAIGLVALFQWFHTMWTA